MIEYLNEHLLKPARREGYDYQENKEPMNDLELLAALQHLLYSIRVPPLV